jgi:peptide/nickel transport system substrate-binding protein
MQRIQRRGRGRAAAIVVLLSLLAGACSSDGGNDGKAAGGDTSDEQSDVDPAGVLKVATVLTLPTGVHLDPTMTGGAADLSWIQLVLGTLLRHDERGTLQPMMAKSYRLVDAQTVQFTLPADARFSDGTPFDGEAVRGGLLRTRDQVLPSVKPSQDSSIGQIDDIVIDSDSSVTVKLKTPVAGQFLGAMAQTGGAIVSPAQVASAAPAIDAKAIGAGPYKVTAFQPGQQISVRKNLDHWDAESWRLGGVDFVNVADGAAKVNGLKAGAVDLSIRMLPSDATALKGDPAYGTVSAFAENAYYYLAMCTGKPPFDKEAVRQAVNRGIDRSELNELVFGGLGQPAFGLWPEGHAYHEPKLESLASHDPAKAKKLLGSAGEVSFDLYYPTAVPDLARVVEVLQGQLAEVGVKVTIQTVDILNGFIAPQKPGAMVIPGSRTGISKYSSLLDVGQRLALCGVSHPEVVEALAPSNALPPGDERSARLFREADLTVAEHAYFVPLVFAPLVNSYAKARVGGTPKFDASFSFPLFDSMYIKKK